MAITIPRVALLDSAVFVSMIATILLFSDDPVFGQQWRPAFEELGCDTRATSPDNLPVAIARGGAAIFDLSWDGYDEDEILTAIGYAASQDSVVAADLSNASSAPELDEVLDEICQGLVLRRPQDRQWAASLMVRRLDRQRARRFEYVTISPSNDSVLVILADGYASAIPRPLCADDDESEIQAITLSDDATMATLELASGVLLSLESGAISRRNRLATDAAGHNGASGNGSLDANGLLSQDALLNRGALGARLKKLRLSSGLTQAELARRTGIHRPNIARVEAGRHTPSLDTISRIATAIGVPATEILRG